MTAPIAATESLIEAEPPLSEFARGFEAGRPQLVWTRLVADLETPVSAMLKLGQGRPMSFLLESVEGGAVRGRYSIIGLEPESATTSTRTFPPSKPGPTVSTSTLRSHITKKSVR